MEASCFTVTTIVRTLMSSEFLLIVHAGKFVLSFFFRTWEGNLWRPNWCRDVWGDLLHFGEAWIVRVVTTTNFGTVLFVDCFIYIQVIALLPPVVRRTQVWVQCATHLVRTWFLDSRQMDTLRWPTQSGSVNMFFKKVVFMWKMLEVYDEVRLAAPRTLERWKDGQRRHVEQDRYLRIFDLTQLQ